MKHHLKNLSKPIALLAFLLTMLSQPTQASDFSGKHSYSSPGWYFGLYSGVTSEHDAIHSLGYATNNPLTFVFTDDLTRESNPTNLTIATGLGYEFSLNRQFHLALEGIIQHTQHRFSYEHTESKTNSGEPATTATFSHDIHIGFDATEMDLNIKPLYYIKPRHAVFAILGAGLNHLRFSSQTAVNIADDTKTLNSLSVSQKRDKPIYSLRLGLGYQFSISKRLRLNTSYAYTHFNKFYFASKSGTTTNHEKYIIVTNGPHQENSSRHTFLMGLEYVLST